MWQSSADTNLFNTSWSSFMRCLWYHNWARSLRYVHGYVTGVPDPVFWLQTLLVRLLPCLCCRKCLHITHWTPLLVHLCTLRPLSAPLNLHCHAHAKIGLTRRPVYQILVKNHIWEETHVEKIQISSVSANILDYSLWSFKSEQTRKYETFLKVSSNLS